MQFTRKKLAVEQAEELKACPIKSVQPYALMHAPAYVYMKLNRKFVAVKAPLDFFTPEELERLAPFETIFFPPFIDKVAPFRDAARSVRALLAWSPGAADSARDSGVVVLPPAPFEISDAVIRIIGPLWSAGCLVEPFFIAVFANELCNLLPAEMLKARHDEDVERFESALLRSAWMVFLSLHLGYCNLDYLNRVRMDTFEGVFRSTNPFRGSPELDELFQLVSLSLEGAETRNMEGGFFAARPERVAQKIRARLDRVEKELIRQESAPPSIFGREGFLDG